MAGKKLQFVMTSFMNNEPKYVFILSIPENMENMKCGCIAKNNQWKNHQKRDCCS